MKKLIIIVMVLLLCGGVFAHDSQEKITDQLDFDVNAGFSTKQIWRGQNLSDESVLQPSASVKYENLTLTGWGNLELSNDNDNQGNFTKIDSKLDYTAEIPGTEILQYSVGFVNYEFPHTSVHNTSEVYAGLKVDTLLSPSLTIYRDICEVNGIYASAAVEQDVYGVKGKASLGWGDDDYNDFYWGKDGTKLNDLALSASYPIDLEGWIISPSISYIMMVSNKMRESLMYGKDSDFLVFGINASKRF